MTRVLVTGALGQIGSWLVPALRAEYGAGAVLATDLRDPDGDEGEGGPFRVVDATDRRALSDVARQHRPSIIYHLAAVLSALGENDPARAWLVNVGGLESALDVSRANGCALFVPSSIAVFGPDSPSNRTPQKGHMRPTTMYGVTKLTGELLCDYHHHRFNVDVRGLRFPGLVSHGTPPGGGTTDWAVEMFHHAVEGNEYPCFLSPDTRLDYMYMPDAVRAAMELMEVDGHRIRHRNAYNVTAMQLSPSSLANEVRRHLPGFAFHHRPDPVRQAIADSWPQSIDDSTARDEWGWSPNYGLREMTADMLRELLEGRTASTKRRHFAHART